jgi:hypothetical protein
MSGPWGFAEFLTPAGEIGLDPVVWARIPHTRR